VFIYRYVTEGSFDAYMWQALETKARFIGQVMTGDLRVRQAEDIGGQELSYAEVKAIASGNPAVLTLAEADAEVKRLTILKKHHTDEQYLARRAMRELPEQIARLENRLLDLTQDSMTAAAHVDDPIVIDGRAYNREYATEALAARLNILATGIHEACTVPLGTYRGLTFGLGLTPGYTPEVYVEGKARRRGTLSRDHHGPRAVLNAVERLVTGYDAERERAMRDLHVAQGQLRDYTARRDGTFAHDAYLEELTGLRHQLESALSDSQEASYTGELVERIKALHAAHTVEAAPEPRSTRSSATTAEPVTTRIRARRAQELAHQPEAEPMLPALLPVSTQPSASASLTLFELPLPCGRDTRNAPTTPARASQKRARRASRTPTTQLRLF
jgi:hypothetical protein